MPPPAKRYDYEHKVLATARPGEGAQWVVAILRFGDTKDVEEVPFGPASQPSQTGPGQASVDIRINEVAPAQEAQQDKPQMNKRARELLKSTLVRSQAFTVVERERVLEILREINFGQSKYADQASAPEVGQLLAVQYLIEGSLGLNEDRTLKNTLEKEHTYKDGLEYDPGIWDNCFNPGKTNHEKMVVAIRKAQVKQMQKRQQRNRFCIACYLSVYEVRTGQTVTAVMGLGSNGLEAIEDAVEELITSLSEIKSEIHVAAVNGEKVYLDAGKGRGLVEGSTLEVIHQEAPIRDQAGQTIGYEETEVGEIEVVEIRPLLSVARVVRHASHISRGDVVRPAKH